MESEARYRSLFEDMPVPLCEFDYHSVKEEIDNLRSKGVENFNEYFDNHFESFLSICRHYIIEINQAMVDLWGFDSKNEYIQFFYTNSWLPYKEFSDAVKKQFLAIAEGKTQCEAEWSFKTQKGIKKYVLNKMFVPKGYEHDYSKVLQYSFDITPLRQAEMQMDIHYRREEKLNEQLEKQLKQETEFFRLLAHELKTPLCPLLAASETLVNELPEGSSLKLARQIHGGACDLNARIDDLLDLARGEVGLLKKNLQPVNIVQLLHEVAESAAPEAIWYEVAFTVEIPDSLPLVTGDSGRLRQVVLNLLTNAFKFTPSGGKVILRASQQGSNLLVEVQDNGCGIPKRDQKQIFVPYYKRDSIKERFNGLGLGLALCKQLVQLHNGEIWVESSVGKGSIFKFQLPLETL
jgi:signal transduction histidine kinase